ncbi:MAG: C1 family peptidase [Methanobacterium paludis]|nr:C1 family peptidase [Methanobacterium paludis]
MINTKAENLKWIPDLADHRDFTVENVTDEALKEFFDLIKAQKLPDKVDLRDKCSPVEDQGDIGSCTANALAGILEYWEKNNVQSYIDASRLFTYYVTRHEIEGQSGDTGATIRDTMKSLNQFGTCTEKTLPYITSKFDEKPSTKCFKEAEGFESVTYVSLKNLTAVQKSLAAGIPVIFGTTLYSNICDESGNIGQGPYIPLPGKKDQVIGGHAIVAVGFFKDANGKLWLIFRNSWGTSWGENGYGYIDAEYFTKKYATDYWVLLKDKYVPAHVEMLKAKLTA